MNICNLPAHHHVEKDEMFNLSELISEIIEKNIIMKIFQKI